MINARKLELPCLKHIFMVPKGARAIEILLYLLSRALTVLPTNQKPMAL